MSKIYEKNITSLNGRCQNFEKKIEFFNQLNVEEPKVIRQGDHGLEFFCNGQYYKTSSIHPKNEIIRMTKPLEEKKDFMVMVVGIGNVDLLREVMDKITEESRVLIFEPNPYLLKYTFQNTDISFLLESNQVGVVFEYNDERGLEEELYAYSGLWKNLMKNIQIIVPPNAFHYKEKYQYVFKQFISGLNIHIQMLGNCLEDILNGQENNYKNVDAIIESNYLEEIKDKFKGYPGIVVASGPSLDRNIDILHKAQDKALIIACDASMKACGLNGVRPDAVASIERDEPTYQYYYKGKEYDKDVVLVGPSVLWPEIFQDFKGKKIITSKVNTGIERWWAENFEDFQFLNQGMSSANVAFAYAKYAGCNPIILVGQDLAYTGNKKHSDLTHTEFEGENDSREADGLMTEDIHGNMVPTDEIYNLFRKWFETQIATNKELKVIDASEGGAKINGSEIMPLQEAIDQYCTKKMPMHMYDCLMDREKLSKDIYIKKYSQLINSAKKQQRSLKKLQSKASKHYRMLETLYYDDKLPDMSEEQLVQVLLKMQKGDTIIQSMDENLITYFQQMIRQTIIFVKSLGNEITPENVIQNIRFQANLMGVIKNSVALISQEYDKMIAFLEEKKAKREGESNS